MLVYIFCGDDITSQQIYCILQLQSHLLIVQTSNLQVRLNLVCHSSAAGRASLAAACWIHRKYLLRIMGHSCELIHILRFERYFS